MASGVLGSFLGKTIIAVAGFNFQDRGGGGKAGGNRDGRWRVFLGGISCKARFGTPGAGERGGLREALGGRIGDRSGRLKLSRQGGGENVRADRDAGWRAFLGGVKPEGWVWHSWRRGVRRIRIGGIRRRPASVLGLLAVILSRFGPSPNHF